MIRGIPASRARAAVTLLLTLVAIGAFAIRITSIAEPLGIDQSLWASAVRGMSRGQRLYRDVWEQRPPGIYWIYLAGFRLLGWKASTVAWLDIIASAATCVLLGRIVRALSGAVAAAAAAALYAALTMPAWLYGYDGFLERSICETFILPCVALGAWCATRVRESGSDAAAAALGLVCGAAVVLKPNAGAYFPALLLWMALHTERQRWVRATVIAVLASPAVPLTALLWLWRLDILHDARVAVIDFNRYYVSEGFAPAAYALQFSKAVWLRMKTDPLWVAGTAGAAVAVFQLARRRTLPPLPALAIIWGSAAALVMVVNGARLFNSYFMNPLPPLTLMAAWLFADASRDGRGRALTAIAAGVLCGALLVHRGYVDRVFGWAAVDAARLAGRGDPAAYLDRFGSYANGRGYSARANAELAGYIRGHTAADDRIFLFGISGAGVYFGSDRLTAHRFLRVNFFVDTMFPDPAFRLASVIDDLEAARPRYLIFERLNSSSAMGREADGLPENPAVQPLLRAYHLETRIEDFTLYRLGT